MARTASNESTTERQTRPRKSAAQKAEADYKAAVKTRDHAQKKLAKLEEGVAPAREAFEAAQRRVDYLGKNPDLPEGTVEQPVQPADEQDPEVPAA